MKNNEVLKQCIIDRENSFGGGKKSFVKENCIDLCVKFLILMINSIGKKRKKEEQKLIFIDEIDNSNMRNNLNDTICLAESQNKSWQKMNYYTFNCSSSHLKIGFFKPVFLMLALFIQFIGALTLSVFSEYNFSFWIQKFLVDDFILYLDNCSKTNKYYIMSDHHFFSSVIAMCDYFDTYVIQHGLILDKRFYYPIRAKHFCAWGQHSKELLENNPKVIVTGTKKFDYYRDYKTIKKTNIILYCISSLNEDEVFEKIQTIYEVAEIQGYMLYVKCHPGSMFDVNTYKNKFADHKIRFFKEEKLTEIDFDLAISENSTINIDFVCLKKPFLIYDNEIGYFEPYRDLLPVCNSKESLMLLLEKINTINFVAIQKEIVEYELNNGRCTLLQPGGMSCE